MGSSAWSLCIRRPRESIWGAGRSALSGPPLWVGQRSGPWDPSGRDEGLSVMALSGPGLAVDGAVRLGFASKTDDSPEAAPKLLQDEALCHGLRLVGQLRLLRLLQQTVTRHLRHFLCYECVRQPREKFINIWVITGRPFYNTKITQRVLFKYSMRFLDSC